MKKELFAQCRACTKCITNRYEDLPKVFSLRHQTFKDRWVFHFAYEKSSHAEILRFCRAQRAHALLNLVLEDWPSTTGGFPLQDRKTSPAPSKRKLRSRKAFADIRQQEPSKSVPTLAVPLSLVVSFWHGEEESDRGGQGAAQQRATVPGPPVTELTQKRPSRVEGGLAAEGAGSENLARKD